MKNNYIPVSIRKLLSQRWESDKHYIEGDRDAVYTKRYDDEAPAMGELNYIEIHEMIADGALEEWMYSDDGEYEITINANVEDSLKAFLVDASEAWERHQLRIKSMEAKK